jgi:DNA-binding MarR family transcriptional regulator
MTTEIKPDQERDFIILEHVEGDPDVTQASLAAKLGVAVGTVNWHMKRLVEKGYVKVKRAQRRKLRYIITPDGLRFRAGLTVNYLETSMRLYRRTRERVREHLLEVKQAGYDSVLVVGDGDIADICKLTCIEQGVKVTFNSDEAPLLNYKIPVLEIYGTRVLLKLDNEKANVDE